MARMRDVRSEGSMAPFFIASALFHILLLILYPQWEASPVPGTMPGSGVLQFTLRSAAETRTVSLQPVSLPTHTPQPGARPSLQPVQTQQQQVQVHNTRPQVASEPIQPVLPAPTPQERPERVEVTRGQKVEVERPTALTPPPRPEPEGTGGSESAPVVTSPTGTVPVQTGSGTGTGSETSSEEGVAAGVASSDTVDEPVVIEPPPPPPPPPPTVGSMLSFPGGTYLPKAYTASWGTVSVRVVITVDETGRITDTQVDPAMRAADERINGEAMNFARQFVRTQKGPEGQAYRATVVVTFSEGGTTFATNPNERVEIVGSDQ